MNCIDTMLTGQVLGKACILAISKKIVAVDVEKVMNSKTKEYSCDGLECTVQQVRLFVNGG